MPLIMGKRAVVLALALLLPYSLQPARVAAPDLLLFNANVITIDPQHPSAEAIAIEGENIVWIGSTAEAGRFGTTPQKIDLHRATVLPG